MPDYTVLTELACSVKPSNVTLERNRDLLPYRNLPEKSSKSWNLIPAYAGLDLVAIPILMP